MRKCLISNGYTSHEKSSSYSLYSDTTGPRPPENRPEKIRRAILWLANGIPA